MVGALWTGISGLAGQQTALDNESNNIANVNTIGYKASRISFADQMYQDKIGKGTTILDAEKLYKQGNLKLTGVEYDMALSGDGFFSVASPNAGGTAETYYTRAGNFRMGDNGRLQDAAGNEVQGWAMSPLTVDSIESTDQNVTRFTEDFSKLAASQIIKKGNTVETYTAKMTNYNEKAKSDSIDVFTGADYKKDATKISNVETLTSNYSSALISYKNNPEQISIAPSYYSNTLNFNTGITNLNSEGDNISIYVDGAKYTQPWDTNLTTTLKAFVNQLSNITGLNAWITDTENSTAKKPTEIGGYIRIESIIPGDNVSISQLAVSTSAGASTPGTVKDSTIKVEAGSGYAAVVEARKALEQSVTGKQQDAYLPADIGLNGTNDYSYQISIYEAGSKSNILVPTNPLAIVDPLNIDAIVSAINLDKTSGNLGFYVEAMNINGSLVVQTLNKNYELEFAGDLKATHIDYATTTTVAAAGGVNEVETYDNTLLPAPNGTAEFSINDGTNTIIISNAKSIDDMVTQINAGTFLGTASKNTNGKLVITTDAANSDLTYTLQTTATSSALDLIRNTTHSGREGADAEFLEIKTVIEQSGSRGALQLKLDSLGITDSPFGSFAVDNTGLITMNQDGARFAIGQVAIALFNDNRGLEPIGDNLLRTTDQSGSAIFNLNNNKTADIKGATLELSTADLSESLVNLMVFQRAFEANAKSITTADAILNTLIQLKR